MQSVLLVTSASSMALSTFLVVLLHRLEREYDPSWRMLSEYSLGRFGYLMRMAFILGAIGVSSGALMIFSKTGLGSLALILTALGPLGAAFVDTDPITTSRNMISMRSKIHSVLGSVYILGFPLAATFTGITSGNAILGWSSLLPWLGLIWFMVATLRNVSADGVGSPSHKIGWPNRFNMIAYFLWIAVVTAFSMS